MQSELTIKFLSALDFRSVCEAGYGLGRMSRLLLESFTVPKEDNLGCDLSPDQIQRARASLGDKANFLVSTIEEVQ
jgi:SAM-dependent methyltransferase